MEVSFCDRTPAERERMRSQAAGDNASLMRLRLHDWFASPG